MTVPARGDRDVRVDLSVPIASAGDASTFNSVSGLITFTPASASDNSGIALHVPYLLVPQASSDLRLNHVDNSQFNPQKGQTTVTAPVTVTNPRGAADSIADWFAWGLKDARSQGSGSDDLQAAGVQSFPSAGLLFFAVSTAHRWSNPAENEIDVLVDTNGDGTPDYDVVAIDDGILTAGGVANGEDVVAVFNLHTDAGVIRFLAGADFNGSTMELPVRLSDLGITASSPPISYTVESFSQTDGSSDSFTGNATYNVFHPPFTNNGEDIVAPGATASDPTTVDLTQWAKTPQLGLLVLTRTTPRTATRTKQRRSSSTSTRTTAEPEPEQRTEGAASGRPFSFYIRLAKGTLRLGHESRRGSCRGARRNPRSGPGGRATQGSADRTGHDPACRHDGSRGRARAERRPAGRAATLAPHGAPVRPTERRPGHRRLPGG